LKKDNAVWCGKVPGDVKASYLPAAGGGTAPAGPAIATGSPSEQEDSIIRLKKVTRGFFLPGRAALTAITGKGGKVEAAALVAGAAAVGAALSGVNFPPASEKWPCLP